MSWRPLARGCLGEPSRVFAFLPLEEGSVGTYHPRFEDGHHAIRSEMMRAHHAVTEWRDLCPLLTVRRP